VQVQHVAVAVQTHLVALRLKGNLAADEVVALKLALADAIAKTELNLAGWQRARADYMNLLKEVEQEKSEWASWSKLHIIEEFIPVYDNFKKAFAHRPAPNGDKYWHNWAEGVGFIMKQFGDVLKSHEIEEIKTVGDPFNPERHETVAEEESDEYPEHAIIREVDGGYMLKGKVIRAAKVVVAKKKE